MARQWEALVAETESPTIAERAAAWRARDRPEPSAAAAEFQSMPDSASQNGGRRLATAEDEMARHRARSHLSVSTTAPRMFSNRLDIPFKEVLPEPQGVKGRAEGLSQGVLGRVRPKKLCISNRRPTVPQRLKKGCAGRS